MHGARSIGQVRPQPAQCGQSRATATLLAGNATRCSATHMPRFCGHRVFLSFPLFSFHDPTASYGRVVGSRLVQFSTSLVSRHCRRKSFNAHSRTRNFLLLFCFIVFFCYYYFSPFLSSSVARVLCVRRRRPCSVTPPPWRPIRVCDIRRHRILRPPCISRS